MGTVQSTYADNIDAGYVGAIVNLEPRVLISRTVEAAAGLAFGLAVIQGTEDKECLVATGSATIIGVTVRDQSVDPADPDLFAQYSEARIMTKGVIWIANSGGVVAGDIVHSLAAGALAKTGGTLVVGARWETTALTGELAQLRLA
jgi:hypothetical protein